MLLSQLIEELQSFLIDNGDMIVGLGTNEDCQCVIDTEDLHVIKEHVLSCDFCMITNDFYYERYGEELGE